MALSILNNPTSQAAYDPSAYTLEESASGIYTLTDFRFIAVVKNAGGTQLAKFKFPIYPNSTNKGVVSVSRILETQVGTYFDLDVQGLSNSPVFEYEAEFGKEYSSTEYLNEVAATGVVCNGTVDVDLDQQLLTTVTERTIHRNELGWVYVNQLEDPTPLSGYRITYRSYAADGTLLSGVAIGHSANVNFPYQFKYPLGYNTLSVASGNIVSGALPVLDANCAYYTVEVEELPFAGSWTRISQLITYNVVDTCSDYIGYTLNWLNERGGFDSWYFQFKRMDNYQIQREQMKRNTWELNGNVYAQNDHKHSITNYITKAKQVITLNSDNLSTADSQFLKGLITSPLVYLLDGSDYYPVNILADGYDMKTNQNDSVFNLTVRCEIADWERLQRL